MAEFVRMDVHEIELPEPANETDGIARFCRLAQAYVLALATDDQFRVEGRIQGAHTREMPWTPADGARALATLVADYREYFEAIHFPPVDVEAMDAAAQASTTVHARGVGLRLLTVRGDAAVARRLEHLAAAVEEGGGAPLHDASDARGRSLALFAMTWPAARGERDDRALAQHITTNLRSAASDTAPRVRATALGLVGRYRILALVEEVNRGLSDPHAAVRRSALEALRAIDDGAALAVAARLLCDDNAQVRHAAWATLRHLQHVPWARRRDLVGPLAVHLRAGWAFLAPHERVEGLEWLVGCPRDQALEAVAALRGDPDAAVRTKVAEVLGTLERAEAVSLLVDLLGDVVEDVQVAAVEALSQPLSREVLQRDETLRATVMARLATVTGEA